METRYRLALVVTVIATLSWLMQSPFLSHYFAPQGTQNANSTSTSPLLSITTEVTATKQSTTTDVRIATSSAQANKKTTPVATSTTPKAKKSTPSTSKTSEITVSPVIITSPPEPAPDFEKINTDARKAIVNILCTTKAGALSPISGTGVIVSSGGLVLTNAHIAQYFLLENYIEPGYVKCVARTGSPAYPTYNLELVYISPTWIANNPTLIKQQNPKGTGENDYAFLRITGRVDGSLQNSFSFIPMDVREDIAQGENVLLASYPAGFLGGQSIIQDLNLTSAITQVGTLYTFKDGSIDLISVPGTIVSQKGSSGGAVVDKRTHLIGLISLSSSGNTTKERDLQAITSSYINRDLKNTLGISLVQIVYGDYAEMAKTFAETTAPKLTKILTDALNS